MKKRNVLILTGAVVAIAALLATAALAVPKSHQPGQQWEAMSGAAMGMSPDEMQSQAAQANGQMVKPQAQAGSGHAGRMGHSQSGMGHAGGSMSQADGMGMSSAQGQHQDSPMMQGGQGQMSGKGHGHGSCQQRGNGQQRMHRGGRDADCDC